MRISAAMISAELLKVRKRWLLFVLILFLLAGAAVEIWLAGYLSWRTDSEAEYRADALRSFVLPYALPALLETGQSWGAIVIGILVSSSIATEYGWSTVRQGIVRGQTRAEYLTTKLVGLTLVSALILLLALSVGLIFSLIATSVAGQPITFDAPDGPSFLDAIVMVLRSGFCIVPYAMVAFTLTVVGRSTALGVAGTLLFVFGEAIVMGILLGIGGLSADFAALLPAHNVNAIMSTNRIGDGYFNSLALRDIGLSSSELPDPWAAAGLLALYTLALAAIAYAVFQKRDLITTSGAS